MKRILWICNIMMPVIAQELGLSYSNREGWLSGIFERVQKETASGEEAPFTLGICFPFDTYKKLSVNGIACYAFEENLNTPEIYDDKLEQQFKQIIQDFKPDIIHLFGTEFPHTLAAVRAFQNPKRTLIGIQGLCGEIAKVYMADLPEEVQKQVTFRDWIRKDSLRQQQQKFIQRGQREAQAIQGTDNITGRTQFDREGTAKINANARYFHMNETLRSDFYTGKWSMKDCEKHSIFLGQGDYPLKGLHFVLEAMNQLAEKYADIKLYIAGNSIIGHDSFKDKIKLSAYGKYLLELIREYGLEEKVCVTGKLSAQEMKQQFLRSSVFVCASVLENSPNTVGEAMLLGVPVVAFRTGGIPNMITDGQDGVLAATGDATDLARAIDSLWDETADSNQQTFAQRISEQAYERARCTHNSEANYQRLLEIYNSIQTGIPDENHDENMTE